MAGLDPVFIRIEPRIQGQQALLMASSVLTPKQIHDLRVLTKQIRACLRLYKPFIDADTLRKADRLTKKIADQFAGLRDSHVQTKTLNKLLAGKPHIMLQLQPVYEHLQAGKGAEQQPDLRKVAHQFDRLLQLWQSQFQVEQSGWWRDGALYTYQRAVKRGRKANLSQVDDDFHDWRKWVKYWLYQVSFLADVEHSVWKQYPTHLKKLGDDLGVFQDLCVLEATLIAQADVIEDPLLLPWLLKQLARRKTTLKKAFASAHKDLFSYRKKPLAGLLDRLPAGQADATMATE